jgi:hypothetical protein
MLAMQALMPPGTWKMSFFGKDVVPLLMIGEGLLHHVDGLLDAES